MAEQRHRSRRRTPTEQDIQDARTISRGLKQKEVDDFGLKASIIWWMVIGAGCAAFVQCYITDAWYWADIVGLSVWAQGWWRAAGRWLDGARA